MRIIGEFDRQGIKITVFKMNDRISIKFEYNLLEQTYKFRDGSGIATLEDAMLYCNDETIFSVLKLFKDMTSIRSASISKLASQYTDEEEII
jgi:hypothetical protein